jgi:glycerol-1-phosphate dehydrogenase [NAD(P)+]
VPHLVRLKKDAWGRLPVYFEREGWRQALALISLGLPQGFSQAALGRCPIGRCLPVEEASWEWVESLLGELQEDFDLVIGLGGGQALDVAKYVAFRLDLPYLALPTSLSNDGFCSPRASLTRAGRKVSLQARMPVGVVVDLEVVRGAPEALWLSGVGDLVSKWTALFDWKLAFHAGDTPYDDMAAMLSDASVFQLLAHPRQDAEGVRLLAQALMLNGVAMEMAGCSRPASGSEHLISHALDQIAADCRPHGLQVGLATYWMALVQGQSVERLVALFAETGFWRYWKEHPLRRSLLLDALQLAPTIKERFTTVLDTEGAMERATGLLYSDPYLLASQTF